MKKIALILSVVLLLQSCDHFRRMAGRPTSDEINAKRELIARNGEIERKRQAELEAVRRLAVDSLNALEEIRLEGIDVRGAGDLAADKDLPRSGRYYVIIGAYRAEKNARKMIDMLDACGFASVPIYFGNGYVTVGASPVNRISESLSEYRKLRKLPFCPENSWILDIER